MKILLPDRSPFQSFSFPLCASTLLSFSALFASQAHVSQNSLPPSPRLSRSSSSLLTPLSSLRCKSQAITQNPSQCLTLSELISASHSLSPSLPTLLISHRRSSQPTPSLLSHCTPPLTFISLTQHDPYPCPSL